MQRSGGIDKNSGGQKKTNRGLFYLTTTAFVGAIAFTTYDSHAQTTKNKPVPVVVARKAAPAANSKHINGLSPKDAGELLVRFDKEVWPVLQRACLPCHSTKNASQFLVSKEPKAAFYQLVAEGHFDANNHASIIERVTTTDKQILMPPPAMGTLTRAEIALFAKFSEEIQKRQEAAAPGSRPDEVFPAHLELPFAGKAGDKTAPNTFLTYRQLRGKVKAIFNDDWRRGDAESGTERDLFVENSHLFGGADFLRRFDETNKPAAPFLTGVDMMGRDVASRAYLEQRGPFTGLMPTIAKLPPATTLKSPTPAYKLAINTLYNRMLFRDATSVELAESFALLQTVAREKKTLDESAPHDLRFDLSVRATDGTKFATTQGIRVAVTPDARHALTTEYIDQSRDFVEGEERKSTKTLAQPLLFQPGDDAQQIVITNERTYNNVSVAGVVLRGPLPAKDEILIKADDAKAGVQAEGAWRLSNDNGFASFEDFNENKGKSRVVFPVRVPTAGQYEVALLWRRPAKPNAPRKDGKPAPRRRGAPLINSAEVRVEVVSRDKTSRLAMPILPAVPPKGQADFYIDQTVDTLPYWDLRTAFQFSGANNGIEIRTNGTLKRVVADAVRLMPPVATLAAPLSTESDILLRGKEAVGKAKWAKFAVGGFNPYNVIGPDVFQDGADGEKQEGLSLRYEPTVENGLQKAAFYRVGLVFPGQVENETRVPVRVYATASAPIVQVAYPPHAHVGATVSIDASKSFNVQQSPLKFFWRQVGGPRVALKDPTAAKLTFVAPRLSVQQASWEGLCRALMLHPDFLFTRPRSLATVKDDKTRRRLQLVKIAQDLLSRTPTTKDIARIDAGTPLATLVDEYLQSSEFHDTYFHRARLYVESHGGVEQDEPARLWSYIARNDLPFQQLLIADYTVDAQFKKQARPTIHGKTGILTMRGFIEGKPGLPHFNYPAQVCEKFLGYVFEVPDEVLKTRDGITASATTDPQSMCYSCHKVLTPLAYQRQFWTDEGKFSRFDESGMHIDDSDQDQVASYPYKGSGMESFALQAQNKERFVRTMLQTHFVWYFGRELRYDADERTLYKKLWDNARANKYAIRPLIRTIVLSPQYLGGTITTPKDGAKDKRNKARLAKLAAFHLKTVNGWKQAKR